MARKRKYFWAYYDTYIENEPFIVEMVTETHRGKGAVTKYYTCRDNHPCYDHLIIIRPIRNIRRPKGD